MDHWGDPWADNNAEHQKSPIKDAVTSPLPPALALAPAPVLLNPFLDDAGWGNQDESFGDWTAPPANDAAVASVAARVPSPSPSPRGDDEAIEDAPRWDVEQRNEDHTPDSGLAWTEHNGDTPDGDNVTSDTSETSTTIQPGAAPDHDAKPPSRQLQPDDDSSARPSTSQSETSRTEAPAESPRTSFEEEGGVGKHIAGEAQVEEEPATVGEKEEAEPNVSSSESDSTEDEFGTSTADTLLTDAPPDQNEAIHEESEKAKQGAEECPASPTVPETESTPTSTAAAVPSSSDTYHLDTALLDELFPPSKDAKEPDDAPEDPVYSTSGRKAWYRLTRKQTMREFNSGNGGDNYVRVTWTGSQVRSEINKTVARWAREDRLSGTGPGARASFYWDTPAPVEPKMPRGHQRTKTSIPAHIPTQRAAAPMRQSLPPVATNTPAAFNWSSPTSTVDPWKQDSPGFIAPPAIPSPNVDNAQTQELRPVSVDLTRGIAGPQGQTSTVSAETSAAAKTIPPPVPTTILTDSWGDLRAFDTNSSAQQQSANVPDDDDDDWGEMISSPTVSTPISAFPASLPATRDNTLSTLASTPETPPDRDHSADAMHAASIVRLRSTISPTSAIFGPKSFVPLHVEQGPIGPGLLKPVKRTAASIPEKPKNEGPLKLAPQPARSDEVKQDAPKARPVDDVFAGEVKALGPAFDEEDDFSAFESSTLDPASARSLTPPPPAATPQPEPMTDAWVDADFSFFESAPSTTATASTAPLKSKPDPSDPFSVFATPPRPTSSAASSAKTFTRSSPPRNLTPPAMQPLTGATNAAQRRKNEEEAVIKDIIAGLPDLRHISFPEESQERMESCLRLDPGFSASGLVLNENGSLLNRDMVALSQFSLVFYRKAGFYFDDDFLEHARTSHQEFLLTMIWVRQDSIRRMFKPGFEGSYRERTTEVEDAETVPGVMFEDPGMSDDTSTAAVLTPSITRSTSPAITERSLEPGQDETRRDCSTMSTELPTLEFMAIIETSTDKAMFRMGGSDIHDTARARAYTGLNMCEHMIRKGYGGKVKLQDIIDMALRTA
ncbi:hypothetical protein DDE83_008701 [Stemphylium lycopersici]|uniref:Uncharacterized protein n=1 Tax=Stemphylium lycopersici TaxID=183478 RepID=A0A364MSF8_STELY|nr:hypothetical protein DDE83_008701 [Stemphylium lycopersici]